MIGDRGPTYRKRRVIRARDLQRSTRLAESVARMRTGTPQIQLDGIPLSRTLPAPSGISLCKTNGSIAARSSLTLGHATNNVRLYTVNIDGTIADSGTDLTAYNATGGTIASGKYCFVAQVGPLSLILSVEC